MLVEWSFLVTKVPSLVYSQYLAWAELLLIDAIDLYVVLGLTFIVVLYLTLSSVMGCLLPESST